MDNVVDIYELSPMQQGMLFHTIYAPDSGVYFEQRSCLLEGKLNTSNFKKAWQQIVDRYPILRTAFYWEDLEKPLQVVFKNAELPWVELDWSKLTKAEQINQLENWLKGDRTLGFILDQPPLMRCALIRLDRDKYRFVWSHHHILMDGWCNGILLQEVLAIYQALNQGEELYLEPPLPYRNYIVWLQEQETIRAKQYWQESLAGFDEPTRLSTDVKNIDSEESEINISLSQEITTKITAFTSQYKLTLNTLIQGAWALLLSRYCDNIDVLFGATVSGRPSDLTGVESMVGLFINTLPVRVQVSPKHNFIDWLQQIQAQQITREQYSYTSLVDIQKCSDISGDRTLFDSLVVVENYPIALDRLLQNLASDFTISNLTGFEKTNYPLTLYVIPGEKLKLRFSYNRGKFTKETVKQIGDRLFILLANFIASPHAKLSEISIISKSELKNLLSNKNAIDYPNDQLVHQLIENTVGSKTEKTALITTHESLSYNQLNIKANQLAHYLQFLGVNSNSLVGIYLERNSDLIISLLAVLKTGAAYVPLDPSYPTERIHYIINDAEISFLIVKQNFKLNSIKIKHQLSIINLEQLQDQIQKQKKHNLNIKIKPQDLAYVIYTSGSTGSPKGVAVQHSSLLNFLYSMQQQPGITPDDKLLAVTTVSFDIAALEIYLPLITGATVVLADRETSIDADKLSQRLASHHITIMQATPATWQMLIDADWQGSKDLKVLCGGEALPYTLATELESRCQQIWNLYGPTETTIWSSVYQFKSDSNDKSHTVPIGKPIANTQFYILDSQLNPVPPGIPGELYIGGAALARGYLNRPKITAEKFIPNPVGVWQCQTPCQTPTIYKTGDKARYLPNGEIEYVGRLDNQVKIRGFRIELGEIEAVLRQHPSIQAAVVIADEQNLIAYYIAKEKPSPTTQIRSFLQQQLPPYMIPARLIELPAFPLTPNGKINRKALPLPHNIKTNSSAVTIPQTATEEILLGIWSEILDQSNISTDANFFELGGHSLLATRVISQIRQVFSIELPLRNLFEHPTIISLAQNIEREKQTKTQLPPPIEVISRDEELPLSFAQQRQWFLSQLEPDNPWYNIATAVKITGKLDIDRLQRCFDILVERQEILRTSFITVEGKPRLIIKEQAKINIASIDLTVPTSKQQQAKLIQTREAQQPFVLDNCPLMRVKLLVLDATEHILLLSLHHIIADGWSMGVLVKEIAQLYSRGLACYASTKVNPIQYADYAVWQRKWLQGEVLKRQLDYWTEKLADAPAISSFPSDYPRNSQAEYQSAAYSFRISNSTTQSLKQISRQTSSTLFMTLFSALALLLHRYTDNNDIIIGTPIANRHRPEIEGLIGFFANTLALRVDLSGNPSFTELLTQARETALQAYTHQDLPFEQLVDKLKLERSLSYTPLFQVMLVLQRASQPVEVEDLTWKPLKRTTAQAKFELTFSFVETQTGLEGSIEYNRALFTAETIHRLAGNFRTLLTSIAENPEAKISNLTILSRSELEVVNKFNPSNDVAIDKCIHQLFEAQTSSTPDAIAIVAEGETITYRELNAQADALAHYLQSLGVGVETQVGIMCDRSIETIVALLAILKAGGCYIPLDPNYPQQRLDWMLEDTQLSILLTETKYIQILGDRNLTVVEVRGQGSGDRRQEAAGRRQEAAGSRQEAAGRRQEAEGRRQESPRPRVSASPISLSPHLPISPSTPSPDNLAYIMYTSGSTGKPKGVAIPHRGVVRLVKNPNYVNLDCHVICLQAASISFDASTFEIWGPLLHGGQIVILSTSVPSLEELAATITKYKVNTLWLTAGLFHLMVDEQLDFRNVRQLLAGGDVLSSGHIQRFLQAHPQCSLINGYGPTESTTFACCYPMKQDTKIDSHRSVIGYPISNTQLYILDQYLNPVPIGVPGELYIAGAGLARGYLNHSKLTAEKFIPNPFEGRRQKAGGSRQEAGGSRQQAGGRRQEAGVPARSSQAAETSSADATLSPISPSPHTPISLLYKTGDRAKYLSDGKIEYLGRIDNQVKIRGFRVELGEIEAALNQISTIKENVVLVQENAQGNKQLVAFIVPQNLEANQHQWRAILQDQLPDYLVPSVFVTCDRLPLTANGKVDRKALLERDITKSQSLESIPPQTEIETQLAQIWSQVLDLETVNINDNFFSLGGDSILAIQIVAKANQAGLQITLKQLFQNQTIAELGAVATIKTTGGYEQGLVTGSIPLTPIQTWFFQLNLANVHHFNQSVLLETKQDLDLTVLQQSITQLLIHHDALRIRFEPSENGWQQYNYDVIEELEIHQIDLSNLSPQAQPPAITRASSRLQSSLNISEGFLFKVAYFNLGQNRSDRLLIIIHHLLIDGVSWRILLEDLQTIYQQQLKHKIQLPAKTTSYKQWSQYLQDYAKKDLTSELDYWLGQVNSHNWTIPVDCGSNNIVAVKSITVTLNREWTQALLKETNQTYNTQINDILLTALVKSFAKYTNVSNLLVDLESQGRTLFETNLDISRTVGWFTNIYPVYLDLGTSKNLAENIKTIKEKLRQAQNHSFYYSIIRYLQNHQQIQLPSAPISFNYLGQFDNLQSASSLFKLAQESTGLSSAAENKNSHLIQINSSILNEQLQMEWSYSQAHYQSKTIASLAHNYIEILQQIITHCQSNTGSYTPSDFSIAELNQDELDSILDMVDFN